MKFKRKNSSETTESKGIVVGYNAPQHKLPKIDKRWFKVGAIILLAVVLCGVAAVFMNRDSKQTTKRKFDVCKDIVPQAAKNLSSTSPNIDELHENVHTIETRPGYQADADCVYIELSYYLLTSDDTKARVSLNKLEAIGSEGIKFDVDFGPTSQSFETLRTRVEKLESNAKETEPIRLPNYEGLPE